MSLDINDFIANFKGGARPNRYEVVITYPSFVSEDGSSVRFVARSSNIPPATLGIIEVPFQGRTLKVHGDRTFPEWTVTMFNEEDFKHRNALETWSNAINEHVANTRSVEEYTARAQVTQLSVTGEVLKTYVFENVWPSEVGQIELGMDNNDSIEEFTVTFQYSHWTASTTS